MQFWRRIPTLEKATTVVKKILDCKLDYVKIQFLSRLSFDSKNDQSQRSYDEISLTAILFMVRSCTHDVMSILLFILITIFLWLSLL
jgi:hypothetical protein